MGHQMTLRVKITERATGRIITPADPDDRYYPFECAFEDGRREKVSSVGYADVCLPEGGDIRGRIGRLLESRGVSARFGRDVPLTADILRDMGGDIPPAFAAEIPDSADAENFREHPEDYAVEYFLENYFGQKTRN